MEGNEIAIISMSCRFPGSRTPEEFWRNLVEGVDSVSEIPREDLAANGVPEALLKDPKYVARTAVLGDVDKFDADFWGINRREAELMDPQHRLFLECAWEAVERGGYDASRYPGRIGVYAGTSPSTYFIFNVLPYFMGVDPVGAFQALLLNDKDYLCTRVSYKMNLRGPSVTVQTACSTSLVAVHFACQSLLSGECDMALAGGATVRVPEKEGYLYQEGGVLSPDGHCRAFDARAGGTSSGAGVGVILLKRLEDAIRDRDAIVAVVKGTAINNDGSDKVGYTAPSVKGQAEVIEEALGIAEVDPSTIGLVEAHGTGTPLGDPIEIAALTKAYRTTTEATQYCAIGSLKTNLGHMDAAAGVGGLMKAALSLSHRKLIQSLHFETPNPQINLGSSPFYVSDRLSEWESVTPRRAAVSSFGIGGTNAHAILEEAPSFTPADARSEMEILLLSAKTATALATAATNLGGHLVEHPELKLSDVAHTLQVGRQRFPFRGMAICQSREDAIRALSSPESEEVFTLHESREHAPVSFLFPGQGAQYAGMSRGIYESQPVFKQVIDDCAKRLLRSLEIDIRDLLFPAPHGETHAQGLLAQTLYTQPALFAVEYALAQLWMSWGIVPGAMIGHSLGELVAATLAGVMTLESALDLVAARGRLIQSLPAGGAMLSVSLDENTLASMCEDGVSVAAVNAPEMCVASGPKALIEKLEGVCLERGIPTRKLQTSHAFHSRQMEPVLAAFRERVAKVTFSPPRIPFISNVTGDWITAEQAMSPDYWVRHLRETVRFGDGVQKLISTVPGVLLEMGPGRTLSTFAAKYLKGEAPHRAFTTLRHPQEKESDVSFLMRALGWVWLAGVDVEWEKIFGEKRSRVVLPTYPFERKRYWLDRAEVSVAAPPRRDLETANGTEGPSPLSQGDDVEMSELERRIVASWREFIGVEQLKLNDDFFQVGGDSLVASRIVAKIKSWYPIDLSVRDLLEAPTPAKLGVRIEELLVEKLGGMTDEEAEALLAQYEG